MNRIALFVVIGIILSAGIVGVSYILSSQCPESFNSNLEVTAVAKQSLTEFLKNPDSSRFSKDDVRDVVKFREETKDKDQTVWQRWCNRKYQSGKSITQIAETVSGPQPIPTGEKLCGTDDRCYDSKGDCLKAGAYDGGATGIFRCENDGSLKLDCLRVRTLCIEHRTENSVLCNALPDYVSKTCIPTSTI